MLLGGLLQQRGWRFDLTSALIGAAVALILARIIYQRREQIKAFALKLWSPVVRLRSRAQASQEDRYITALKNELKSLLLFQPADPRKIFQPPTFAAPPPLPTKMDTIDDLFVEPLAVRYANLTAGHPRLVITGPRAAGRTMALAMQVWQTAESATLSQAPRGGKKRPYERFPLWIDLAQYKHLPEAQSESPAERLVQLAALFMPGLVPRWVLTHLRNEPALILVDNWESLPHDARRVVARWFGEVAQSLPKSCWVVASGEEGYGPLIEAGFVSLELIPPSGKDMLAALYRGWAELLGAEPVEPAEETFAVLKWAEEAGASLLELNTRVLVYLRTRQLPTRPVDVLDRFLDHCIPTPNLGEGQADVVEQARVLTLSALSYLAKMHRLEGRAFTQQEIYDQIGTLLPPEEVRPPKLEGAIRRMLFDTQLLKREGKFWVPAHYIWDDFLTAWALVEDEVGADIVKAHLGDPTWTLLMEFYAALEDVTPLVHTLIQTARVHGDMSSLLRAARWGAIAPPDAPWQKSLMKALAQTFTDPDLDQSLRLRVGQALAVAAGEGARAFFIQTLRQPSVAIRSAALRGLGWSGSPREMPLFVGALQDPDLEVQQAAIEALGDMGTAGAVRLLRDAMLEADDHLLPFFAEALSKTPDGLEVLKESVDSESLLIRRTVAQGLGRVDQPWAIEILEKLAREDAEWLVRSAAQIALSALKEKAEDKTVPLPPPQIDQLEWLIAWAASQGMGLGVGKAAAAMLERAITQGDPKAQILGILTLTHVGREAHLKLLEPLLNSPDADVRDVAESALRLFERRYDIYQP
ncbi:MAG: HEAT repeat domain-containing protein [Anaerolineae bacterium]